MVTPNSITNNHRCVRTSLTFTPQVYRQIKQLSPDNFSGYVNQVLVAHLQQLQRQRLIAGFQRSAQAQQAVFSELEEAAVSDFCRSHH